MKGNGKSLREEVIELCKKEYKAEPERLWAKYPEHVILRHGDNRKWFALFMDVERNKLGLEGEDAVSILNIKADPEMAGLLVGTPGYFPAYHMSKAHWMSVLLDGTVDKEKILSLVETSFVLTGSRRSGSDRRGNGKTEPR